MAGKFPNGTLVTDGTQVGYYYWKPDIAPLAAEDTLMGMDVVFYKDHHIPLSTRLEQAMMCDPIMWMDVWEEWGGPWGSLDKELLAKWCPVLPRKRRGHRHRNRYFSPHTINLDGV